MQEASDREATVADVAQLAGVSKATAARALGAYGLVSDEVRERVAEAAEELDYRANGLARSMNTGRSRSVGVVVGDIENPYFALAVRGITDTLNPAGYNIILANSAEKVENEARVIDLLAEKRVDGFIVAPASSTDIRHLQRLNTGRRPVVLFDRRIDGFDADVVEADMVRAGEEVGAYLAALGHRDVSFLSSVRAIATGSELLLETSSVADRLRGLASALERAGAPMAQALVKVGADSPALVSEATQEVVRMGATALVASDSIVAMDVLRTLDRMGRRVPADVSFVMLDDAPWSDLVQPGLTSVTQPVHEIGASAARLLLARLTGDRHPVGVTRHATRLVVRGSTSELARRSAG